MLLYPKGNEFVGPIIRADCSEHEAYLLVRSQTERGARIIAPKRASNRDGVVATWNYMEPSIEKAERLANPLLRHLGMHKDSTPTSRRKLDIAENAGLVRPVVR